jgi:hypothetical protein
MSTFNTTISIINNSSSDFTFSKEASSGTTGDWPSALAAGETYEFTQGWDFQIKFDAWYNVDGSDEEAIEFVYYADGVEVFDCKVETQPDGIFAGSTCDSSSPKSVTFTINGKA